MIAGYIRTSTKTQNESLLAQRQAIEQAAAGQQVAFFIEQVSGKSSKRIELTRALEFCRQNQCPLFVAKLDRLARNTKLLLEIIESGVVVRFLDYPQADKFLLTILAAVAEYEATACSARTKAVLALPHIREKMRRKRSGYVFKITESEIREIKSRAGQSKKVQLTEAQAVAKELRQAGMTLKAIAAELEARGIKTARGRSKWDSTQVRRLLV